MDATVDDALVKHPLEAIGSSVSWFVSQLTARGIRLHDHSALAIALERLGIFRDAAIADHPFKFSVVDDAYEFFSDAMGADFLTKTVHRGVRAGLVLPDERWRHFAAGDPIITRPSKTISRERDLTWEVVLASVIATFASNVRFAEPDVLCDFSGRAFAVAAKQVRSDRRLWTNVERGVRQSRGRATAALVFVNVVNLLPVVHLMRAARDEGFAAPTDLRDWMLRGAHRWCDRRETRNLAESLGGTETDPVGVAFFMPVMLLFGMQPLPFFYTHMPMRWQTAGGPDFEFATSFLRASNHVLGFSPAV